MGTPRGASPLFLISFPLPFEGGKGIQGIGLANKNYVIS